MRLRGMLRILFLLTSIALSAAFAAGNENLRASLIIVGPGDPMYTYWGHIGIAIEDTGKGESLFYDFGNFSFYSDHFYRDFAMGRMLYLGYVVPTDHFLAYSLAENRDLRVYPLNLGAEEIRKLDERLRWWVLPENREYLYDYFLNNCSTVIRDILDEVTRGQLEQFASARPDLTFRHHARTGTAPSYFAEVLVHFLLGPGLDRPITWWDRMFQPAAVAELGSEFDYTGADGAVRRLVGPGVTLKKSDRPDVPETPRILWPGMLLAGVAAGLLWRLAGSVRGRGPRIGGAVFRVSLTLAVGIAGAVLGFMMLFTDHAATYSNSNLGPAFPAVLAGLFFTGRPARLSDRIRRRREVILSWIWTVNLAGVVLAVILRASGLTIQDSGAFWAFFVPLNLAASRAGLWLTDRIRGRQEGSTIRDSASSGQAAAASSRASGPAITDIDL